MDNYAEILGHEPTDRTRRILETIEGVADKLHRQYPALPMRTIYSVIRETLEEALAEREQGEG